MILFQKNQSETEIHIPSESFPSYLLVLNEGHPIQGKEAMMPDLESGSMCMGIEGNEDIGKPGNSPEKTGWPYWWS